MDSDSDNDVKPIIHNCGVEIEAEEEKASLNSIPEASRKKYESTYKLFLDWMQGQELTTFSENVLLAYFVELSKKYKASTLWTTFSMIRALLNINENVDISKYYRLKAFMKRQIQGYKPKKPKYFTSEEINKFIKEAPDEEYLLTKVILIMGILGDCRMNELYKLQLRNINDLGSAVLIRIPNKTKPKCEREFAITGHFYDIYKKYALLRPPIVVDPSFFLNYFRGKCTTQKVGINKFGTMGKNIAMYLKLPNPKLYTGHCFRRSSIVSDDGRGSLKRHTVWRAVAEDEIPSRSPSQSKPSPEVETKYNSNSWKPISEIETTNNLPNNWKPIPILIPEADIKNNLSRAFDSVPDVENTNQANASDPIPDIETTSSPRPQSFDKQNNLTFELNYSTDAPRMVFNNCSNITFYIVRKDKPDNK